jgi:hypothetical protein
MSRVSFTVLQITTAGEMLQNQGLAGLPTVLTNALSAFNAVTIMANINSAITDTAAGSWASTTTLLDLQSIRGTGNNICAGLGNSIPPAYPTLVPVADPSGFTGLIQQTGNNYLGAGDVGRFCQGFQAIDNYCELNNSLIDSTTNAQTYLGPTFDGMDDLITDSITSVTDNLPALAVDLANQGELIDTAQLESLGTPAGLLNRIATVGNMRNGSTPAIESALIAQGLTNSNIADLVNLNRASLFNPAGLSTLEFDRLQKQAYPAFETIQGGDLEDVLVILEISTANIASMADLLDPAKTFPNSYTDLRTPSPQGPISIYKPDGSVDTAIVPEAVAITGAPSACDDLSKIIPPALAVANKAIQAGLEQIKGISQVPAANLAQAIKAHVRTAWSPDQSYLTDDVVAYAPADPVTGLARLEPCTPFLRAQQPVPAAAPGQPAISIADETYWKVTTGCGINVIDDLELLEYTTEPVSLATVTAIANTIAIGSGPANTVTLCDALGTAVNRGNLDLFIDAATANVTAIIAAGSAEIANLGNIYSDMSNVADGTLGDPAVGPVGPVPSTGGTSYNNAFPYFAGDLALQALITVANANIANIVANVSHTTQVTNINSAWNSLANVLAAEKDIQTRAGVDYFNLLADEQVSVITFVKQLAEYGTRLEECGPRDFLQQVANTETVGGQAIVAVMREGQNNNCISEQGLPTTPEPSPEPAVTPSPPPANAPMQAQTVDRGGTEIVRGNCATIGRPIGDVVTGIG